ncbi:MAG: flagellar protein FlgN [Betaproteobacteria bacterium]|nr:flagellar protein FlgN [Betaproteobacteria bacterium]
MSVLHARLLEHLTEENAVMRNLLKLVEQEQLLLIQNNIKNVQQLLDEKSKYISELSALAHQRHLTLRAAGQAADESAMQAWLEQNTAPDVKAAWEKLLSQTRAAKAFNRTNGLLINTQLTRNQNTLNILSGSNNHGNFYGPNGQTTRSTLSRGSIVC